MRHAIWVEEGVLSRRDRYYDLQEELDEYKQELIEVMRKKADIELQMARLRVRKKIIQVLLLV
jgi:hypothetical protein